MRRFSILLGIVAVIALVTVTGAFAEEAKKGGGRGGTMGEITKIDGKALTIKSAREGAADVIATVDDDTQISAEALAKLADLKVGDRVRIQQGEKRAFGEITKIDGKAVTVKGRGDEETITVDDNTTMFTSAKAKFEDLKVGQKVMASIREGKLARITIRAPETK
ncbi:MAG: DUF5666 domain-containing protein [Planctomycetota bacterium]|jgi:preprotein translocase subunit YajC|nr:DUF5666 domain-containing protein [Planctomycetota bacterium]